MEHVNDEFAQLYRDYYARIKKLCFGYVQCTVVAEDLVQETFLAAWKHWSSFRGDALRTTWLYRIAVNKCLSYIKKPKYLNVPVGLQIEQTAANESNNEAIEQLYEAIKQLDKVDRLLIGMYLDELAYKDIAAVLGMRENNIAVRIHRIKKQLTEIFNRYEKL